MTLFRATAFSCLVCLVTGLVRADDFRYWTTARGRKSDVRLSVVEQDDASVKLKRQDTGKVVHLRIEQLSRADQEYLRLRQSQRRADSTSAFKPDDATYGSVVRPFFQQHCLKCHGPERQQGDFRVDEDLPNDFVNRDTVAWWSEVLNVLNSGEMPPEDEPRPDVASAARVAGWIEGERLRGARSMLDRGIVLRRMNREEYNNTIRDLIGLDLRPADLFPEDPPAGGFDNNGDALTVSPLHLEMYLQAASKVLDRAIITDQPKPITRKWRFEFEDAPYGGAVQLERDGTKFSFLRRSPHIEHGMIRQTHDGYPGHKSLLFIETVPQTGEYIIRVRAAGAVPSREETVERAVGVWRKRHEEAMAKTTDPESRRNRQTVWEEYRLPETTKFFGNDFAYDFGPPRLAITGRVGGLHTNFGEVDVDAPLSSPCVYEFRTRLTAGQGAQFSFRNIYRIPNALWSWSVKNHEDFPRPTQYLDWLEIEGPVVDDWPPTPHKRIFIETDNRQNENEYAREILLNFMRRAFRRPLHDGEIAPYLALYQSVRGDKPSFEAAMKTPLIAILSSPLFLFLVEPDNDQLQQNTSTSGAAEAKPLTDYELASRLSYFLWSTMPDDGLFQLAELGRLNDPQVLTAQVDRMLADPKANELVSNFAGQWLRLREVGANPPVADKFPRYDDHLQDSMRRESEAFFAHILHNDRPVTDFLQSDYVTINERLARFYGISGVKGDHFRVVNVPGGTDRGGLVTQASILAITSNGTRTSPVWRGVWILDQLLGDPPGDPPPDAGEIPPAQQDLSKATVRERLQVHRDHVGCARCHSKIDPLGFALENFDASGFWRNKETTGLYGEELGKDPDIDSSAQMPDGTQIDGVPDLQAELLKRKDQFMRNLAARMATYALGREMSFSDDEWLDELAANMSQDGDTLRALIKEVVTSERFRSK